MQLRFKLIDKPSFTNLHVCNLTNLYTLNKFGRYRLLPFLAHTVELDISHQKLA